MEFFDKTTFSNKEAKEMPALLYFMANPESRDLFRQNSIPTLEERNENNTGFVFPAQFKERAIQILGWQEQDVVEIPTSEWSVDQLEQRQNLSERRVSLECHDDPSPAWQEYLNLVKEWLESRQFDLPCAIHYCYGRHEIYKNGTVHICFGGSADYRVKVWFLERNVYYQRFHIWIGELGPEHSWCRDMAPILLENFVPMVVQRTNSYGAEKFPEECADWIRKNIRDVEQKIDDLSVKIRRLQQALIQELRSEETQRNILLQLTANRENEKERLQRQFEEIRSRDYVKYAKYQNGILSVYVERILVDANADTHDLGEYEIKICTDGREEAIRIFNMTRKGPINIHGGPAQHPHVDYHGVPCFGTAREVSHRYLASREYLALLDILYGYLKGININDTWGRNLVSWPRFE